MVENKFYKNSMRALLSSIATLASCNITKQGFFTKGKKWKRKKPACRRLRD